MQPIDISDLSHSVSLCTLQMDFQSGVLHQQISTPVSVLHTRCVTFILDKGPGIALWPLRDEALGAYLWRHAVTAC